MAPVAEPTDNSQVVIEVPEPKPWICRLTKKQSYAGLLLICVVIVVVVSVSILFTLSAPGLAPVQPHIVLIVADDMGYNDIGYYNQHNDIRTPFLDQLSTQGMRLDTYYAQSVCTPSRAALVTGRYPFRFGLQGARPILYGTLDGLPEDEILLPQILKTGGYVTYLVGKWHLGFAKWAMTPVRRGFDYFYGMYGGFAHYFSHISAEPTPINAFDMFEDIPSASEKGGVLHRTLIETRGKYSELLFTQRAVQVIEDHDADTSPMFLMLSYMNPHSPLEALEDDIARASHVQNEIRRNFTALMSSLDYAVQDVVMTLKRKGIYDNTIIVFTGDNGGAVAGPDRSTSLGGTNYPFRGAKWTVWEGGVRVPSFIVGPGITAGSVSKELFHITDWVPTLAKLASIKLDKHPTLLDGVDQTDLILNNGPSARQDVILEMDLPSKLAAIRSGDFKLIVGKAGTKPLNSIYSPLRGNADRYEDWSDDWYSSVSKEAGRVVKLFHQTYVDQTSADYNPVYPNISYIGEFTHDDVSLYDVSSDVGERYDLFNANGRLVAKARELYDRLVAESQDMAVPKYLGKIDQTAARKKIKGTNIWEWTPFLED